MEYTIIVYSGEQNLGNEGYIKYRSVNNLTRFRTFVDGKYPKWRFYNIYDKKTRDLVLTIKK